MRTQLREILQDTNEWLRFAEAKNAIVVAAGGTGLGVSSGVWTELARYGALVQLYLVELLLFLAASVVVSLISFLPKSPSQARFGSYDRNKAKRPTSILYFGDIQFLDADALLERLYLENGTELVSASRIERTIADQIINNSRIAATKMNMFALATRLILMGLLTIPIGLLVVYRASK